MSKVKSLTKKILQVGLVSALLLNTTIVPTIAAKATPAPKPATSVKLPKSLDIAKTSYFGDAGQFEDAKKDWPKYMEGKYKMKFNITSPPRNNFMEKINLMITSGELKGLVALFSPDDLLKYKSDDAILPLDDYLKDNEVWNSLPRDMREMYKYDGKIWAIPSGYTGNFFTRSIRKDWLDKLNLKVPETVEELYEVAKAFTEKDPDGNGIKDTVGLTSSATWNLQDIFQAFDARLNHTGDSSLAYDPVKNAWNDSMLNPGMEKALTYLNDMYKNGYLDKELFTNKGSNMRENMFTAKYGSSFYWLMWGPNFELNAKKNDPSAKIIEIPVIKGTLTSKLNQVTHGNPPYVLIAGTKDPKEVANAFVNTFFGSKEGWMEGRYGVPDKNFKYDGKNIVQQLDAAGTAYSGPALVDPVMGVYNEGDFPVYSAKSTPEEIAITKANLKRKGALLDEKLKEGVLYTLDNNHSVPFSEKYTTISADLNRVFADAVVKAVIGEMTPQAAMQSYREQAKKLGAQQVLDDANKALGTKGFNSY